MKLLHSVVMFLFFCTQTGCTAENPQTDISQVPKSKIYLADPFILRYNDTYYAYGTHASDGIEVYSSKDLQDWKKFSSLALSKEDSYGNKWFWAPEVYYNKENQTFYMYYSAEEHICVATSKSPLGPFKQAVQKPMRTEKSIDSSLFIDDDGTPYLFFVRFTNGNVIWVAQLEPDLMTIREATLTKCIEATEDWELQLGKVVEGPSVFKSNGTYYLLYSANDYQSQDYGVGYATSFSPMGTWSKSVDNPILQKPSMKLVGTGHGAMFLDKAGKRKYVFHSHFSSTAIHPRYLSITDMLVDNNGKVTMSNSKIITPSFETSSQWYVEK